MRIRARRGDLADDADLHAGDNTLLADHETQWFTAVPVELDHFLALGVGKNPAVADEDDVAVPNTVGTVPVLRSGDPDAVLRFPIQVRSLLAVSTVDRAQER